MHARVLALALVVVIVLFTVQFAKAWQQEPISVGASRLISSGWSISVLSDFFVGTLFTVIYLWLLNGPSFCFIPCRIWAILTPFLGNFIPLMYVAYLLFTTRASIVSVLLPFSSSSPHYHQHQQTSNSYNKTIIRAATAVFATALAAFVAVCVWAWSKQSLSEGWATISNEPWTITTFADNLAGLSLTLPVIIAREQSFVVSQMLWTVALALLGNGGTCLYVLAVTAQARSKRIGFASCLLTQRRLLPVLPQEQHLIPPHHQAAKNGDGYLP